MVPIEKRIEQPVACACEHVVDVIESVVAAVIGIRNLGRLAGKERGGDRGIELAQESGARGRCAMGLEGAEVGSIHRKEKVEALEVADLELTGAVVQAYAVARGGLAGARIGEFAGMPPARAAGIERELREHASPACQVREDSLRQG